MQRGNAYPGGAKAGRAGMTLLEIMIASGIMGMALVFLMGSLANVSSTAASSEERAMAASHVASVLEEIGRTDFDGLLAYQPPGFRGLRNESIRVSCVDSSGNARILPLATGVTFSNPPNPIEVRVMVTWQGRSGHPYRVTASTMHRF